MSYFNLKNGDLIYYPTHGNGIYKLISIETVSDRPFRAISMNGSYIYTHHPTSFYVDGKHHNDNGNPVIFPATQEWYGKLVHTYPDLEPPPKRKEPREVIKAMFESGKWQDVPYIQHYLDDVKKGILEKKDLKYLTSESQHILIYPYDPETGKKIIDFVDGEVVLED